VASRFTTNRFPSFFFSINPDEAVAYGAATVLDSLFFKKRHIELELELYNRIWHRSLCCGVKILKYLNSGRFKIL